MFTLGKIGYKTFIIQNVPMYIFYRAGAFLDPNAFAIFSIIPAGKFVRFSLFDHQALKFAAVGRINVILFLDVDHTRDHFFGCVVSEDARHGRVDAQEASLRRGLKNADGCIFENGTEIGFRGSQG